MDPIWVQTLIIGGTGLTAGAILGIAARFLEVNEDPRVETVTGMLPGVNCGGCGYPGCSEYAKAIVLHKAPITECTAGNHAMVEQIGSFLGVTATAKERQMAVVLCQGSHDNAASAAIYNGITDCRAAHQVGGGKACRFGCLGFGACARSCPVNAIEIRNGVSFIHPELCIGCGKCSHICPRFLIKMVAVSRSVHVLCRSQDRGPDVKKLCKVGCIGCGICVKTVESKGITLQGPLAVVDYTVKIENEGAVEKCPQHSMAKRTGTQGAS
jgi:electron transport complex protein RnfB